jgi:hypothetical protein
MDTPTAEVVKIDWPWVLTYLIVPGLLLVGIVSNR